MKTHKVQNHLKPIKGIKNIIAIASGKGGVGKSTTAVNLACALKSQGFQVGLLDADIYGPNQPHMLGVSGANPVQDGQLHPIEAHGLFTMSIGYLIDKDTPAVWRGPMVVKALHQMLFDTQWPELDFLLIDLPPGTGDIQLTLAQKVPLVGAVMVATPQDIALLDVHKGIAMFQKVAISVLGVIENMSLHTCSNCGQVEPIFGEGGAKALADAAKLPLLGALPISQHIRAAADAGLPIVIQAPASTETAHYLSIAKKIVEIVSSKPVDYSVKFPKIVVEKESP
jgi:ATP-binding protein involved in chromosome partitioning